MRYFSFILKTNTEQIEHKAKIKLRDYCFDNTIGALNNYMYKNMKNGLSFFCYREEESVCLAAFAYDEKIDSCQNSYDNILGMLRDVFSIRKSNDEPCEITMNQFLEYALEAKRREYLNYFGKITESTNLFWLYQFYKNDAHPFSYVFDERIVSDNICRNKALYDKSFIDELSNVEAQTNDSDYKGNMVHYIIACNSKESAEDMTEMLMQRLYKANRISSRRMEMISEIEPDFYRKNNNHLEEIIENNKGGAIVIDLSEKFGCEPSEYVMACKYLKKLLKRYRNDCLFVFTYNMDSPGFSYYLLPDLKDYVIPVTVREGRGNRRAAIGYMKALISNSEYAQYADQAKEFMMSYPGNDFTQTDVLMAYQQFEAWCINKNIMKAYDYNSSAEFMLERDENAESSYERLNKLIGLETVKRQIESVIATDIIDKKRKQLKGKDYESGSRHMIFGGGPGTAKTTVAECFAGLAKEKGILKSGIFVVRGGMDLDGFGCICNIREAFTAAKGGVLFIDEAYSMKSDIAVTTLIQEMENKRDSVIVILAGYSDRMHDFIDLNEGLKSRIPHWIDFPDYSAGELTDIFRLMVKGRGFSVKDDAVKEAHYIFEKVRNIENFGNGRYVRNMIDRAIENQAVRLLYDKKTVEDIPKSDLFMLTKEDISMLDEGLRAERPAGTAKKELDDMIGLSSVKEILHKAIANYKLNKLCLNKGIQREKASLHMSFTGNPGTAKTTVARQLAEILKDEKVLATGNFVEVGRADLIGDHVGSTAPMVKKKFKEAQGGVLFIDEAYSLCDNYENSFGDEAINTIVQEMENHRDDVIVIFAGYPEPMKRFLERNPGMQSRIAFQVEFDDYSVDELCDITKLMASKKQLTITDEAMEKLKESYESVCGSDDYGNGRFVRKILEEAEMNLAERVIILDESELTAELLTTIEACDIPEIKSENHVAKIQMGFAS